MAANLTTRLAEQARFAIKADLLVKRLQEHTDGKIKLSATQVAAAKILLDKSLPSLQAADITAHTPQVAPSESDLKAKLLALLQSDPTLAAALLTQGVTQEAKVEAIAFKEGAEEAEC